MGGLRRQLVGPGLVLQQVPQMERLIKCCAEKRSEACGRYPRVQGGIPSSRDACGRIESMWTGRTFGADEILR